MKSSIMPPPIGPGPVERVERREVLDAGRFEAAQDVLHSRAFKLEHAAGQAVGEKFVGLLVIQRKAVHVEVDAFLASAPSACRR